MAETRFPDYMQWRPAVAIGKRLSYLTLPAFSVTGLESVLVPDLVRQYNFSASQSFIIAPIPAKPTGANFTLCVKYRVGETVYRYKLWDGETDPYAPLYTGQLIKPNFVLEVWMPAGNTTVVLLSDLTIYTSPRVVPTNFRTRTPVELAALGATVSFSDYVIVELLAETPPSGFNYRFIANDASIVEGAGPVRVTNWLNTGSAGAAFDLDTDAGQVRYLTDDADFANENVVQFNSTDQLSQAVAAAFLPAHQFFAVRFDTLAVGNFLVNIMRIGLGVDAKARIINISNAATYTATGDSLSTDQNYYWHIFTRNVSGTFRSDVNVYDESGAIVNTIDAVAMASVFTNTGFTLDATGGIEFRIPEWLGYTGALTDAQITQVIDYFRGLYGGIQLPLDQNTNIAWLDNS